MPNDMKKEPETSSFLVLRVALSFPVPLKLKRFSSRQGEAFIAESTTFFRYTFYATPKIQRDDDED